MARNSSGKRVGYIEGRTQTFNPVNNRWVVRDTSTGQFLRVKSDESPYKNVRKETSKNKPK